jgi:hypothetical protein
LNGGVTDPLAMRDARRLALQSRPQSVKRGSRARIELDPFNPIGDPAHNGFALRRPVHRI